MGEVVEKRLWGADGIRGEREGSAGEGKQGYGRMDLFCGHSPVFGKCMYVILLFCQCL